MSTTITDTAIAHSTPSVSISSLTFSGGDEIELQPTDKVLIVGANNSGKSRTIRDIVGSCDSSTWQTLVVKQTTLEKRGTLADFQSYIERTGRRFSSDLYQIGDWQLNRWNIGHWNDPMLPGGIAAGFIKNLDANSRLSICDLQSSIGVDEPASCPQHVLYGSDALMDKVSTLFNQAFGKELVLNIRGGSRIYIHVGTRPTGPGLEDRASTQYTNAVRSLPALHEQGDGVRSFAGILFHTIASHRDVTFIDEPEAFLHPPQMRKLGEILATNVHGQLIAATHSSDILRGFLEGGKGNIRILRISREDSVNRVYEANPHAIQSLYSTPVLRYSSALEAIFHEQAIICEDDSDCRLLNSVADHIQSSAGRSWPDTAYVPMGGKSGIASVALILRTVGVPVKAVYDFDLITDKSDLKKAVEAFGGTWDDVSVYWNRISAAVKKTPILTNAAIKRSIQDILNSSNDDTLPKKEVTDAFRQKSQWHSVKEHGLNGLPRGNVREDAERMLAQLKSIGIYLIPSGEIESFCPTIGGHGPSFVTRVLSDVRLDAPHLQSLRDFTELVHTGPAAAIATAGTIQSRLEAEKECKDQTSRVEPESTPIN